MFPFTAELLKTSDFTVIVAKHAGRGAVGPVWAHEANRDWILKAFHAAGAKRPFWLRGLKNSTRLSPSMGWFSTLEWNTVPLSPRIMSIFHLNLILLNFWLPVRMYYLSREAKLS